MADHEDALDPAAEALRLGMTPDEVRQAMTGDPAPLLRALDRRRDEVTAHPGRAMPTSTDADMQALVREIRARADAARNRPAAE